MKNYYLLVRFDSIAVTGFLVFGVNSEEEARKKLIKELIFRKNSLPKEDPFGHRARTKSFIKALNHPWRITKEVFGHHSQPTIQYVELIDQIVDAGYWLSEVKSGQHYCNLINH